MATLKQVSRNQFTEKQIRKALLKHQGVIAKAARELGLSRETLRDWVHRDFPEFCNQPTQQKKRPVPLHEAAPESSLKIEKHRKQRYVVTCAQNNTDLHHPFVRALMQYCEMNQAQLLVIPIRYKNVNSYCPTEYYEAHWPAELNPYYLDYDLKVNKNLEILGGLSIQATALNPLGSVGNITKNKSAIVGHAQIQMRMIATPVHKIPRQLLTTGSCSVKNYSRSAIGKRAAFHHSYGASIVEVDGDLFWTRQINATDDGSFYDLDTLYRPDGPAVTGQRIASLTCGDIHNDFLDENVIRATWTNPDSIVNVLNPEHEFLHDALDFYSQNHHHRNNIYIRYAKHVSGMDSVRSELDRLVKRHNKLWNRPGVHYHYVPSNHNDALTRWLNEADPKQDPQNALLYHQLQAYMLENTRMTSNGASVPNPLAYYLLPRIKNSKNTWFHSRTDEVILNGVDKNQHGDAGANGSRGSMAVFAKSGYKSTTGHGHEPGIEKGHYRVGASCRLILDYNRAGYSGWMHTHELQYQNGKRTLVNIINGRWKL